MKNKKRESYDSCVERLIDESEEIGVYASSQGMFGGGEPQNQPNIIGGYIINEEDNKNDKNIEDEKSVESLNEPYYVFIRVYDSKYKNNFSINGTLDKMIKDFTPDVKEGNIKGYNHAAVSFKLTDDFFGLTTNRKYEKFALKRESCENTELTGFMNTTNPESSSFGVFCVEVSKEEYLKVKDFLNLEIKDSVMKYSTFAIFLQGLQKIGHKLYSKFSKEDISEINDNNMIGHKEKLVCSTFVGYVLNEYTHYKHIFKRYQIDYNYLSPNELVNIPGMRFLYSGKFNEYNKITKEFVNKNRNFKKFYTNVE